MVILIGILLLAGLIVVHEAGHFIVARLFGMRVKRFSIGFFKPLFEWKPRGSETTYSLGILPLGGYVQVDGLSPVDEVDPDDRRSYANQPIYAKLGMIIAGPAANFLTAVVLFAILYMAGMQVPLDEPLIGSTASGMVAEEAGLQEGDRLLSIGGESITTWREMAEQIQRNRGKAVVVEYQRGETVSELNLTPDANSGRIGINQATRMADPLGLVDATSQSFILSAGITAGIAISVWHILTLQRTSADVHGPVEIVKLIGSSVRTGWRALTWLLAQLSLSLCLLNFLPIPALDGGRVMFLAVESITRRKINRTVEGYIHAAGFLLLIGLVLLVTFRDIFY